MTKEDDTKSLLEEVLEENGVSKEQIEELKEADKNKPTTKVIEKHYYKSNDPELIEQYRQLGIDQANESADLVRAAQEMGASGIVETRDDFMGLAYVDKTRVNGMTKEVIEGINYFIPKDKDLKEKFTGAKKFRTGDFIADVLKGSAMGGSILSYDGEYLILESVTTVKHDKLEEIDYPTYDVMIMLLREKIRDLSKKNAPRK